MKSQVSSAEFSSTCSPSASSRRALGPSHEHTSVPFRKERQKCETDKADCFRSYHPDEGDVEQASVIGEAERPPLPSEKPEAS